MPTADRTAPILSFLQAIRKANKEHTKKELFKDLLHRLYHGEPEIERLIDAISAGAEYSILNIPRKDKLHRGSADTLCNRIIIEFENNLKATETHAREQLAGYLLGQFKSGEGYNFTLIASDFITWKVYAPDVSQIQELDTLQEHELRLTEVESASFVLTEKNADDFYFWLDRFLFKEEKQKATLQKIEAFGYASPVFIESFRQISEVFGEAKKYGEVQVSYEQWRKFLSVAYGSFDDSSAAFVIHTYLSILAKVLAYEVLSNDDFIDDGEMKGILTGAIFQRYNIKNFVDNDFFHWVDKDRYFQPLRKTFRLIAQEIAHFDFTSVDDDVLKGVYQELIDLDTRHALGEYYTPDWLCERVVNELYFRKSSRILDPSCGSGSFLRAAVHRLRTLHPDITVEQLNDAVYGIDIHPLSVQIAKTTLLIALGRDIGQARQPVQLNIILANTLLAPQGVNHLFGGDFQMSIDTEKLRLSTKILTDSRYFNLATDRCEDLANQTLGRPAEKPDDFAAILRQGIPFEMDAAELESYYKIYQSFKKAKEAGRDSIWKFIVQNLYKPYFLQGQFDFIVGNPPWFTYSSIRNEEYQNILSALAVEYGLRPRAVANFPHLEIAAIFLAYCTDYFLKPDGQLAFVLPRSFFSADHHDNTRSGAVRGLKLTAIWDLEGVQPLFRIPSCVLFARPAKPKEKRELPKGGLSGKSFAGRLPQHNCNWEAAAARITDTAQNWHYATRGASSALSTTKTKGISGKINPYKEAFKQGATIVPRAFYFVDLDQETPPDYEDRILNVKTAASVQADAKAPWRLTFSGQVESRFLFRTALSKSILPFALFEPDKVALPITVERDADGLKHIRLHSADELRRMGFLKASRWFSDKENIWEIHRTANNKNISAHDYLNWQNKLTAQNLNARYLVLYNASAKDANATVVDRQDYDLEFLVESVAYVAYAKNAEEAYYLAAILNSSVPNELMKDFQAKGLFGPRHVHKKILDIYFPLFDSGNPLHVALAQQSREAHEKTAQFLAENPPQQALTAIFLGRLRSAIKKHLTQEIAAIDAVVGKVMREG